MKRIPLKDTLRLCSGQVITCPSDAVKELIDNSVDSGAKTIEVHLYNLGLDRIQVIDDGSGIKEEDFEYLCTKHSTSKLSKFEDLKTLETLGFRGEALSSICSLGKVQVLTKIQGEDMGTFLEFDKEGKIVNRMVQPRPPGTTVIVTDLFSTIPVRKKYFMTNMVSQSKAIHSMLMSYCMAIPSLRLQVSDVCGSSKKVIINASSCNSVEKRLGSLCLPKPIVTVLPLADFIISEVAEEFSIRLSSVADLILKITMDAVISTPKNGRTNSDRQFVSVNGRPILMPKLNKILNQTFRSFDPTAGSTVYPVFVINLKLPKEWIDINVTPDKRTILLQHESVIIGLIKSSVIELFGRNKKDAIEMSKYSNSSSQLIIRPEDMNTPVASASATNQRKMPDFMTPIQRNEATSRTSKTPTVAYSHSAFDQRNLRSGSRENSFSPSRPFDANPIDQMRSRTSEVTVVQSHYRRLPSTGGPLDNAWTPQRRDTPRISDTSRVQIATSDTSSTKSSASSWSTEPTAKRFRTENSELVVGGDVPSKIPVRSQTEVILDLDLVLKGLEITKPTPPTTTATKFDDPVESTPEEKVVEEIRSKVSREDIKCMQIIGQFNRSFILVVMKGDLFVVDQHAADERKNFDDLLTNWTVDNQDLFRPIPLNLTPYEEYIAIQKLDIFSKNGFKLVVDDVQAAGQKLSLTGLPTFGEETLGEEDAQELLQLLLSSTNEHSYPRPKRVKELIAMKACKSAIKIQDHLSMEEMKSVVASLSKTPNPWTCAHGRPTFRFLSNIQMNTDDTSQLSFSDEV